MKRKLFNAALFAAVLVAAPVGTFVSCADYDSDIEDLNGQINGLETLVEQKEQALQTKITALEEKDAALEAAYKAADEALKQSISDLDVKLSAEIAECKAECAAAREQLQKQIDETKAELAKLNEKHDKDVADLLEADKVLQQNIDKVNNLVSDLNTRFDNLEKRVAANEEGIKNLKTELEKVNAELAKVREEFAAADAALKNELQGKIDELWAQVNANKTAIENEVAAREQAVKDLKDVVDANKAACDAAVSELKNKDAELAGKIETLTNDFNAYKDLTNEEITDLKKRMDAVESQVSTNTAAILSLAGRVADLYNGLDTLEAALEAAIEAQEAVDAAQDLRLVQLEGDVSEIQGALGELSGVIKQINVAINRLTGRVEANENDIASIKQDIAGIKKQIGLIQNDIWTLYQEVGRLDGRIDDVIKAYQWADNELYQNIQMEMEELNNALTSMIEQYAKELSAEVKGFVLLPDNYYEGIQAIEGDVYKYATWTIGTDGYATLNKDKVEYCPEVVANYHVNPSTAVLSTDVQYYHYNVEDRINRGNNNVLEPVIESVEQVKTAKAGQDKNNMLTVKMSITDPTANTTGNIDFKKGTPVTVMALQYNNPAAKAEDPVVTSDYAVLYLESLTGVRLLNENGCDVPDLHTHKAPSDEFPFIKIAPAQKEYVEYTSTWTIEDHIKTKFGEKNASSTLPKGFVYKYSYVEGDQDYFNADSLAKGVVDPQLYNGKEATVACIGKHIIVRVDVVNTNRNDEVAEVGFFDFYIVGEAVVAEAESAVATEDYNISCEPTALALSTELSSENVWNKIVEVTGLTLDEVKAEYTYVFADEQTKELAQYKNPRQPRETYEKTKVGTVVLTEEGNLLWTITYEQLEQIGTREEVPPVATSILVRSADLFKGDGTYNEFYLPLEWNPAHTEVWGADNDGVETVYWEYNRVSNQWQTTPSRGAELRLYADLTKSGNAPFIYDIPAKAMTDMETRLVHYDNFKNAEDFELTNGRFIFVEHPDEAARTAVGVSGMEYTLTVSGTGNQLVATDKNGEKKPVANITNEGVVSLENNEFTKDMLNKYEKNELNYGQTLAAHVSYEVKTCAGKVEVVSGDFDVRFIKPVTLKTDDINISDSDGEGGKVTIDFTSQLVAFNGYTFNQHPEYYDVFALKLKINVDPDEWHTNYNGADIATATLGDYPSIAGAFAVEENENRGNYITYVNNTSVINAFTVRVPVTVSYVWGDVEEYINVIVGRTTGNSNKRK